MIGSNWTVEPLSAHHDRAAFDCGVRDLNVYLQRFARQNQSTGISQHFVAVQQADSHRILGYYALSAGAVDFQEIPDALKKRLPRYPIPVAHIGRLAVNGDCAGQGLGSWLLIDALARTVRVAEQLGIHAVEVVAIDHEARRYYQRYGFQSLRDDPRHLYLPISVVRKLGFV